ncbi:Sugar-specific transcriptional regulator TrmB [Halogranum amylolyticum]|uniref:Sugar-specific transcriptional regulator TrmB n=1 Tax=Halogranum amylolyticum TaxID=660520 RepID=A0A1H8S0I0_9EURY|nr:helix-turn-helix domain-containing protein [Halogranum amylolyticum]SEO72191.1 Sugar-specific transcriptional regulator TrmB [Halogranum amylolyticum]
MMHQQTTTPTTLPRELESPRAKLVYLYLSTHGTATLAELQEALDMKKLSLYSILRTLSDREYVSRDADRYTVA